MPDIQLTDTLGEPLPGVEIDLKHPSPLIKYAKSELLHLAVAPDFAAVAKLPLSVAAPQPLEFHLKLENDFQLGGENPEIGLSAGIDATLWANSTPGSSLIPADPFPLPAIVPPGTGYVGLRIGGSLGAAISGAAGDLTFGFEANGKATLEHWKAFTLGADEPTLGAATGRMLSEFVIPAEVADLEQLGRDDLAAASGEGSLKISSGFTVSTPANALASLDLPLKTGTLSVQDGAMAGISASFSIRGSYQVRARRTGADAVELSFLKQRGTALTAGFSASAGLTVEIGDTDVLEKLLGAISTDPTDQSTRKLFEAGGLTPEEIATFGAAIKDSVQTSLRASLDLALARTTDDQAVFQYEIRPAGLDAASRTAVNAAFRGDLRLLTSQEEMRQGDVLAPGVRLLTSVLTTVKQSGTTLKLNLLGLVNYISVSEFIRKSVVVTDAESGELTITETAAGQRITAEVEPERRTEALRRAMFDSLVFTTAYRVSGAIDMSGLRMHNAHFAYAANAKRALAADYLTWFVLLNLLTGEEREGYLAQFRAGRTTCLLRTEFDHDACEALFFKAPGVLWEEEHYLEIGREAMRGVIDPDENQWERSKYDMVDRHWADAAKAGPTQELAAVMGLEFTRDSALLAQLNTVLLTILNWATAMREAGKAILDMRRVIASGNPAEFEEERGRLQKRIGSVIRKSQGYFHVPWGLIALFHAAGAPAASARFISDSVALDRRSP